MSLIESKEFFVSIKITSNMNTTADIAEALEDIIALLDQNDDVAGS